MKLRNKKTGQEGNFIINKDHFECVDLEYVPEYRNLAELSEEWEDYKEPEHKWYINDIGEPEQEGKAYVHEMNPEKLKVIGNYFETKEEAEKAVEKLKAWKRLKEAGLKFGCWNGYVDAGDSGESGDHFACCGFVNVYGQIYNNQDSYEQYRNDLDLLFGGEDE